MDKDDPWYNHTRMKPQLDEEILERLKRIEDMIVNLIKNLPGYTADKYYKLPPPAIGIGTSIKSDDKTYLMN